MLVGITWGPCKAHPDGNHCSHSPPCSASAGITSYRTPSEVKALPYQFCALANQTLLWVGDGRCGMLTVLNKRLLETY